MIMKKASRFMCVFGLLSLGVSLFPGKCMGLTPSQVFVIANKKVKESLALASYYMEKRRIPEENLISISAPREERVGRADYEKDLLTPVRSFLRKRNPVANTSCLVLMSGVPLKITGQARGPGLEKKRASGPTEDTVSSVDSEMALVYEVTYPLSGWIKNPLASAGNDREVFIDRANVFMVSRLDGPSAASVKRLIDDAMEAETVGLEGNAYIDARWPETVAGERSGYLLFDASLHRAARRIKESGRMRVILNTSEDLFQKGACPDALFYCGWYSLGTYVDAFQWVRGAIGYHIASVECGTLKKEGSRVWCKAMIEHGVAATLGPVDEPYVEAFPPPDLFFSYLMEGRSLSEAYIKSTPFLSWKMVLVGDPLYTPFHPSKRENE